MTQHGLRSLNLEVSLPSGRSEAITLPASASLGELKAATQRAFGQRYLRLAGPQGRLLDPTKSLELNGLKDGDNIAAIALQPKLVANSSAFAMWCVGGDRIITWGYTDQPVRNQPMNVQQIESSTHAFAAIMGDGSVVTWGNQEHGGRSEDVQSQLRNVQQLKATNGAFAAILADKSVVTWGNTKFAADCRRVRDQLKDVQQIQASGAAFAAILGDGCVVTWGREDCGGDSTRVRHRLTNVRQIAATCDSFAAIRQDGSVVTWGCRDGDIRVQHQLRSVQQISSTKSAFAAILADQSVVTWGDTQGGGDSTEVQDQLQKVTKIRASYSAFAAILADGRVITWGCPRRGGDSTAVQGQLRNVEEVASTSRAFAAILADGSVVTWGDRFCGGDCRSVKDELRNVRQICGTESAFAAILADGSVVTWGSPGCGGNIRAVKDQLRDMSPCMLFAAQFSKDPASSMILAGGSQENEAKFFLRQPGAAPVPFGALVSMPKPVFTVDWSIGGKYAAVGSADGQVRVLEAVIDLQLIEHGVVGASLRPRKWWKEPTGAAERLLPEGVEGLPQKLPLISQQRFWHPKTDLQRGLKRAWRARLSATADLPWTREGWSSW
eukprot:s191_g23.t3